MRVVEELPVPFLPLTGLSLYLPNQPSTKEKFPLERVFLFSHSAGAHGTRGIAYCCNSWEGLPSPIIVSRLFITDTRKLLEWEGLGPALPKGDVWPGSEKIRACHRAVLTYGTGTTLWAELAILNWQKDTGVQSFSPQMILQSVTKNN